MNFEKDFVQQLVDQTWPGWVVSGKLGSGNYGSVYEIYREDPGTRNINNHLVCALKVLSMETPAQGTDDGSSQTVRLPGWRSRQDEDCNQSQDDMSKTPRFLKDRLQNEAFDSAFSREDLLLYPQLSDTMIDEFIKSVSAEVNTMVGLKGHPNIVSIEDYSIKRSDQSCMIMIRMEKLECLAGSVREERQVLSRNYVIQLGIDICKALELCERKNVIHRDIKPSNIFFSDKTGFKLGDFGISRTMESIYDSASMSDVGTPRYMAPEIYAGQKYNNTADIYSLGLVLYQLMNDSYLPFIRENLEATGEKKARESFIRRVQGEALPAPAGADDKLASVILKACAYSPKERYSTAADLRHALEQCLNNELSDPPGQAPEKSFWIKAGTGALAAVMIIALGISWHHMTGKKDGGNADPSPAYDATMEQASTDTTAQKKTEGTAGTSHTADEELTFTDPALEKAIRQYLKMTDDEPLTRGRALRVTELALSGGGKTYADKISNLGGLSAFENLEVLDLQENRISDIGELSSMKQLQKLKLERNQVKDLTPLGGLESLTTLEAAYNQIDDLTPVYSLKNLNLLEVIGNRITTIEGIGSLDNLHTFRIGENQLTDISPVTELNDLTYLGFGYNYIEDISALYELPMLHYLTMSFNQIHDISPVLKMRELKWLEVQGNPIDDKSVFDNLPESVEHLEK